MCRCSQVQIEQDDREYGEISDRELHIINRNAFLSWKRQDVMIHTSLPGTYPEGNICSKWETISPELQMALMENEERKGRITGKGS